MCSVCIFPPKNFFFKLNNILFRRSSENAITFNIMSLICVANINLFYYFLKQILQVFAPKIKVCCQYLPRKSLLPLQCGSTRSDPKDNTINSPF